METLIKGAVGPYRAGSGVETNIRLGQDSETVVTELHGKYYETSLRGNVFHATMTAGVIFPAVAATAANVMTLANPAGSGKNVSLISFDMVVTTINATVATGGYALNVNTNVVAAAVTGTAIVPVSALIGSNYLPVAKPLSTSTIPAAPTIWWPFGFKETGGTAAGAPITGVASFHVDFDGLGILTPGTCVTPQIIGTVDTTNATVICAFRWEEIPI